MNRSQLLQHFDALAQTPEAVTKLRELVFQFAVRGRLVSQRNNNESGTYLLKNILEEKRRLIREGMIKKALVLDPITPDDHPFVIPKHWAWAYLNDFGDWGSGSTPNRSNGDFYCGTIPWLKSGELNDGIVSESEEKLRSLDLRTVPSGSKSKETCYWQCMVPQSARWQS